MFIFRVDTLTVAGPSPARTAQRGCYITETLATNVIMPVIMTDTTASMVPILQEHGLQTDVTLQQGRG